MKTTTAFDPPSEAGNPWIRLPKMAPFVLPEDSLAIDSHNSRCHGKNELLYDVVNVLPEPFIGDALNAPIVILLLNPGLSPGDDPTWHAKSAFREALIANMNHMDSEWPFYYLNPAFSDHPGSIWWHKKVRMLSELASPATLARRVAAIQWFPYKSTRFKQSNRVASQDYTFDLVRKAIARQALIVLARSKNLWQEDVPELSDYERVLTLSNVRNVVLTRNNLLLDGRKSAGAWELLTSAISG